MPPKKSAIGRLTPRARRAKALRAARNYYHYSYTVKYKLECSSMESVRKCAIKNCNSIKAGDGITMHRLPVCQELQQAWFRAILHKTGQNIFSEDDVICSNHFSVNQFTVVDGFLALKPDAVPFADDEKCADVKPKIDNRIYCCAFSCPNNSSENPRLSFHPFPVDPFLRNKWSAFCDVSDGFLENKFICSQHFFEKDFMENPYEGGLGHGHSSKGGEVVTDGFSVQNVKAEPSEHLDGLIETPSAWASEDNNATVGERLCVIDGCISRRVSDDLDHYPFPDEKVSRIAWLNSIEAHTRQTIIPPNSVICSLHFEPSCFQYDTITGKKILLASAVPMVFGKDTDDFPLINVNNFTPENFVKLHRFGVKRNQEFWRLKRTMKRQANRIARLAKSIDEFKAKRYVSEEANNALQALFDKVVDTQCPVV